MRKFNLKKMVLGLGMALAVTVTGVQIPSNLSCDTEVVRTVKAAAFSPRLSAPGKEDSYYTSLNPFYKAGYGMPNCTCYSWGRAYEILGSRPNLSTGNANTFYSYNQKNKAYAYGSVPKLGAIACWNGGKSGHVAVVEKISGNTVTISESHWKGTRWDMRNITAGKESNYISNFAGYIYILNNATAEQVERDTPAPAQQTPSIHSVRINTISRDSINFSFSVSDGTLVKVMVESVLTGKNMVKTYSTGLSKITETFNRSTFPAGGNQYRIYLYAYSGSQSTGYCNEQIHKLTYGDAVQYVTFPDTISNEQMKAVTFQYKFYADMYPDLKRKFGYNESLLYQHWLEHGIKEGRIAAPGYSSSFYLKNNADVAKAFGATNYEMAFYHYTTYGCLGEGRDSSPVFSARHYMNANSDIAKAYGRNNWLQAAIHFNQIGIYEFRDSSEYYNGAWYKNNNADLKKLNMSSYDLLLHYYQSGIKERRAANSGRKIPVA